MNVFFRGFRDLQHFHTFAPFGIQQFIPSKFAEIFVNFHNVVTVDENSTFQHKFELSKLNFDENLLSF